MDGSTCAAPNSFQFSTMAEFYHCSRCHSILKRGIIPLTSPRNLFSDSANRPKNRAKHLETQEYEKNGRQERGEVPHIRNGITPYYSQNHHKESGPNQPTNCIEPFPCNGSLPILSHLIGFFRAFGFFAFGSGLTFNTPAITS